MFKVKIDPLAFKVGLGLFVLALVVRLLGINWGLPTNDRYQPLHPDEKVVLLYSQQVQPAKLDFTPGFYNYGTFYLTLIRVTTDVVSAYGGGPQKEDGSDIHEAVARYIKAGRVLSAGAGAGLAWLTFLLLYRRTSLFGAVTGAALVSFAPALVVHSRFMTVDMVATFFATLSLYWATRMFPRDEDDQMGNGDLMKFAVFAGIAAGMSAGTKYTGILALVALGVGVVAMMTRNENPTKDAFKYFLVASAVAGLAFFLTTPGMILESQKFWTDFRYEMAHTSTGHGLVFAGTGTGFVIQLGNLLSGIGTVAVPLGIAGLVWAVRKKQTVIWLPICFFLIVYLLIGRAEVKFIRYTFPLMPVVAMGFGFLVGEAHALGTKMGRLIAAFGILAVGGVGGGLVGVLTVTSWMTGTDPRDAIGQVVKDVVKEKPGTVGLVSDPWFYTPTLYPNAQAGPIEGFSNRMKWMMESTDVEVVRYLPEDPSQRQDWDVRLLSELSPEYVVFSSFELEGVQRLSGRESIPEAYRVQTERYQAFMEQLQKDYELYTFAGASLNPRRDGSKIEDYSLHPYQSIHDMMYIHPVVYLWQKKTDSRPIENGSSTPSDTSEEPVSTP